MAFARRVPTLTLRPEKDEDDEFLAMLFRACSPLAGLLPPAMMALQAQTQIAGHRAAHPLAMRRILCDAGRPVGRVMIDWNHDGAAQLVDIAILPEWQRRNLGENILHAWTEVADTLGRRCALEVLANNPARRLYERLGFRIVAGDPLVDAGLEMERAAGGG